MPAKDYAFAPGTTPQDVRLRALFDLRPNTRPVAGKTLTNVQEFLKHLRKSPPPAGVVLPGANLLVGSHASDEGWLLIGLDSKAKGPIDYETLEKVEQRGSIKINASEVGPFLEAGASLHFKGCLIGKAPKFLELLKKALGSQLPVSAPKYLHYLYNWPGVGVFEGMSHAYEIARKEPFKKRSDVIDAFKAEGFQRFGGAAIPDGDWEKWVPKKAVLAPAKKYTTTFPYPVKISPAQGTVNAIDNVEAEWRVRPARIPAVGINYTGGANPPKKADDQIAALKQALLTQPEFQASHAWPMHERLGYSDYDALFDGHVWTPTLKKKTLNGSGLRYEYKIVVPVVKPGTTDEMIFNFYPSGGGAPTINFKEDNAAFDFFTTV